MKMDKWEKKKKSVVNEVGKRSSVLRRYDKDQQIDIIGKGE